jgi:UDP:flavonoid glycosyltransferase YjiC (YdhE family)
LLYPTPQNDFLFRRKKKRDMVAVSSGGEGEVVDGVVVEAVEVVADVAVAAVVAAAAAGADSAAGLGGTEEEALVAEDRVMSSNLYLIVFSHFSLLNFLV